MTVIKRIDPPLYLKTTKGNGYAHFLIDYGLEEHLMWVVFLDSDGSSWTFENPEIRIDNNHTVGRVNKGRVI